MQQLIFYLLKMTGCSLVLLCYYFIALRNKSFHQYNRFYLLAAVLISLLFPLIKIHFPTTGFSGTGAAALYIQTLDAITISENTTGGGLSFLSGFPVLLITVYLSVSVTLLIKLTDSFIGIRRLSASLPSEQLNGVTIYYSTDKNTPFSFMKKIFWNSETPLGSPEGKKIFRHEMFHVRQLHSLDNMFMQIVLCFAWFNPFFHIIKRELSAIHEFLADEFATEEADKYDYAEYLVTHAGTEIQINPLGHYFYCSPLKRRIDMILLSSKNHRFSYARKLFALPLIVFIFCCLAMRPKQSVMAAGIPGKTSADTTVPVLHPDKDATFPGGAEGWIQYLTKTLRYPRQAMEVEAQGTIVVEFVVEQDGSLRDIHAISGPRKGGLREEAVRIFKESEKWIPAEKDGQPVATIKKQPIVFKLGKKKIG